jgi:hypothetical protein
MDAKPQPASDRAFPNDCDRETPIASSPVAKLSANLLNRSMRTLEHGSPQLPEPEVCRECLGSMTHRLVQPITALRGGIELGLMAQRSAADYRQLLEQSMQLTDDIAQLVVQLRDLGEARAPGGAPQTVDLDSTVAEVAGELETIAHVRGLHLQLRVKQAAAICADPMRLRETMQSLFTWTLQNSANGATITVEVSVSGPEAILALSLPRWNLKHPPMEMPEGLVTPGQLFSRAAKSGNLGWVINQRLLAGLGAKAEITSEGSEGGSIRVRFPLAPGS